jgi:hypothetical protein
MLVQKNDARLIPYPRPGEIDKADAAKVESFPLLLAHPETSGELVLSCGLEKGEVPELLRVAGDDDGRLPDPAGRETRDPDAAPVFAVAFREVMENAGRGFHSPGGVRPSRFP